MNTDKSVLITGGGTGLGAACTRLLQRKGWRVGIAGRRSDVLQQLAQELGDNCQPITLDVSDAQAAQDVVEDFKPDALINAAAVLGQGDITDTLGPAEFAQVQAINVNGSFNMCCAAMRLWHAHGLPGDIINITSLAGIRGMQAFPGFSAYAASKHAVVGLTEALAKDGKAHDIRVNAIAPGMMRTAMLAQLGLKPQTLPEDVAPTVEFLLDRQRSGPITGTTLEIHCNDE